MVLHLDVIPAVASAFGVIVAPAAALVWRRVRARATRRNVAGCCANCGLAWSDIGVGIHEFHVDGARVCAPCAQSLRRRTVAEFAALTMTTAIVSGLTDSALVESWRWTAWWGRVWMVSPPILLAAATHAAVRRMKSHNRNSLMRGPGNSLSNEKDDIDAHDPHESPASNDPNCELLAPVT